MVKRVSLTGFCCLALLLASFLTPTPSAAFDITIDVAPNVLNLESQGVVVTVHTDIAYWEVDVSAVFLEGVHINSWKADNRGNFVAKFLMDEIKTLDGLIIGDYNTLTLVGTTTSGGEFSGTQDIMVVEIIPSKGGK
jgi:hypothetical protein